MSVELQRDCEAALIPSGVKVDIKKGTQALVTQALGSSYTVYINGNLVRIAGKDGDALGLVILEEQDINAELGSLEDKIWAQLKTCYDPEIPVNIVDLGLVYHCNILELDAEKHQIDIQMTLTAPGCGMGPVLATEVEDKIRKIQGVTNVKVEIVFDPPWDRSRVSEEAKLQLGLL